MQPCTLFEPDQSLIITVQSLPPSLSASHIDSTAIARVEANSLAE